MKITVVASSVTENIQDLINYSQSANIELNVLSLKSFNEALNRINEVGDVVFWRSSKLGIPDERTAYLKILKDKLIINRSLINNPNVSSKLYQQSIVRALSSNIKTIDTYKVASLDELKELINTNELKYPFISKPSTGSKGNGVFLVRSELDLTLITEELLDKNIFQNFVENDGDYRVFVVGGRALGVMKRVAQQGSFLNNISQGAEAIGITDKDIIKELGTYATEIAEIFDLQICGVDIILDKNTGEYKFLEVNTVPQWQGFKEANKIDVAKDIVNYLYSLACRKTDSTAKLVHDYMHSNVEYMYDKKSHFASRMYWWTKDTKYLDIIKNDSYEKFLTPSIEEFEIEISKYSNQKIVYSGKSESKQVFNKKYPELKKYTKILAKNMFVYNLFGIDLSKIIIKYIDFNKFNNLFNDLYKDDEAIVGLYTTAINFFYFFRFFASKLNEPIEFDPQRLLDIIKNVKTSQRNFAYFITHSLIGESEFYNKNITQNLDAYIPMLKLLENDIKNNYFKYSLDLKFEFLISCKMLNYTTELQSFIMSEAEESLANSGNYLVDKLNNLAKNTYKGNTFSVSEHRNVLYLILNINSNK